MSKDVINVDGNDVVVREDTAKAYRGVNWAWISVAAFVLIVAVVMAILFIGAGADGKVDNPIDTRPSTAR